MLAEPDRTEWRFIADGLYRQGERFSAENGVAEASAVPDIVVDQAILRGLGWRRTATISAVAQATGSDLPGTVSALLDVWSSSTGQRWRVNRFGVVEPYTPETVASLTLSPQVPSMATADDDYATRIVARYVASVDTEGEPNGYAIAVATDDLAAAQFGPVERVEDITGVGLLSPSQAADIAEKVLTEGRARVAYTEAVQVDDLTCTTVAGAPMRPWLIRPGEQRVRHYGANLSDSGLSYKGPSEFIVGAVTVRSEDAGAFTITPDGFAPRTVKGVVAQMTERITKRDDLAGASR